MSAHLLDEFLIGFAEWDAAEKRDALLAVHKDELACLRFSILETARSEAWSGLSAERRNALRAELACLRRSYSQRIDEIAMALSVQDAMNLQQEVERSVSLPSSTSPSMTSSENSQVHF
jgi:hypothetical protein